MPFKMHKIIFFQEKKDLKKKYVCLPYLKLSDLRYPKHTFFLFGLSTIILNAGPIVLYLLICCLCCTQYIWKCYLNPHMHSILFYGTYMYTHNADPDTKCSVWSGSSLFAYRICYHNLNNKKRKILPSHSKMWNGLIQFISLGNFIWLKQVKEICSMGR